MVGKKAYAKLLWILMIYSLADSQFSIIGLVLVFHPEDHVGCFLDVCVCGFQKDTMVNHKAHSHVFDNAFKLCHTGKQCKNECCISLIKSTHD